LFASAALSASTSSSSSGGATHATSAVDESVRTVMSARMVDMVISLGAVRPERGSVPCRCRASADVVDGRASLGAASAFVLGYYGLFPNLTDLAWFSHHSGGATERRDAACDLTHTANVGSRAGCAPPWTSAGGFVLAS
jgi:hypothetical protein